MELAFAAVATVLLAAIIFIVVRHLRTKSAERRKLALITGGAAEHLQNVLVPDGNGGNFHCDFLLLVARGVVIIDIRNDRGNVFGGDQMTEWTVMNSGERYTFPNPHSALYDRIAAVKAIVRDVPVEGRVVFSRRSQFPKGFPKFTLKLDSMSAEFPAMDGMQRDATLAKFKEQWDGLKSAVQPSSLHNPKAIV
jgi:Nuclease-related domain